ncbi:P-loop containing nucleoside triphosphate hydrolase protein [Marasmius fiardii PR-910]|nr:P-loop containing nucleoside triphosphate hydrolase protein [Marasmius fiardii PR-910]
MTHTIYYRGHWLRIKRSRKNDGCELLSISVVARSNTILKQLVLQAKHEYKAEAIHRIQIYFADSHGSWRWTDSRHKRPMSSIVLNPDVKEMLLSDTKDFLASEKYADRGIPFRRGYLLHGVPGSGKSSLIHAIAGELMLDIYVVSLSSLWISDSTLTTLMGRVPARCIVLLEDLDAAFMRSVSRDEDKDNDKKDKDSKDNNDNSNSNSTGSFGRSRRRRDDQMSDTNTLSLSGLLNALDGVAAAEGRILFATTNHLERLDPALSRPGHMDVWVEFKNASKWQAEALFRNFFPSVDDIESSRSSSRSSRSASVASSTCSSSLPLSSRPQSVASMAPLPPPDEDVALTKEEEDELAKLGIQLPSPPSDISFSPSTPPPSSLSPERSASSSPAPPTRTAMPTTQPPPRTRSSSTFSGWSLSSPPATPSISSISSALWSLPSLASSTASLLSGGAAVAASGSGANATATAVAPGRNTTPKALQNHQQASSSTQFGADNQAYLPPPVEEKIAKAAHSAKPLDKETLNRLAMKFADAIPEEEFSVAALQGYLLKNKSQPEEAADEARGWVETEREMRKKLEKEKEERQEKRKKEREEEKVRKQQQEEEEKKKKEEEEKGKVESVSVSVSVSASAVSPVEVVESAAASAQVEQPVSSSPSPPPPPPPPPETVAVVAPTPAPAPAPVSETEPVVVSLPETPEESDSESSEDSDEENLPPGVRSRAARANPPVRPCWGDGWD